MQLPGGVSSCSLWAIHPLDKGVLSGQHVPRALWGVGAPPRKGGLIKVPQSLSP